MASNYPNRAYVVVEYDGKLLVSNGFIKNLSVHTEGPPDELLPMGGEHARRWLQRDIEHTNIELEISSENFQIITEGRISDFRLKTKKKKEKDISHKKAISLLRRLDI